MRDYVFGVTNGERAKRLLHAVCIGLSFPNIYGGGRVEQRCRENLQCRGALLVWMIVGQGLIALAVGAGGGCLDIFSLIYLFSFSLSLGDGPI